MMGYARNTPTGGGMALLEVDNLTTHLVLPRRTVQAVDGISFEIHAGETIGLVGESGSGKSMTGASILRLLPPGGRITGGSIKLDGHDLTALSESEMARVRGNNIGMVFQDPMTALNPTMSIGDQIAEAIVVHQRMDRAKVRDRIVELLSLVGVPRPEERVAAYPHHLSGGLRQRVCIAMALACEPRLLIADEPTTALDVSIQDQILSLLERLRRELGMAVLLITHDMGVIAEHADRVLVMYAGQIIESASRTALFTQTRHPYTEALLAAVPTVTTGSRQVLATIPGVPPDLANPAAHCRFAPRCAYVTEVCTEQMPVLHDEGDDHGYACFHPRPDAAELVVAEAETLAEAVAEAEAVVAGATVPLLVTAREPHPAQDQRSEPLLVLDNVVKEFSLRGGFANRRAGTVKATSNVSLTVHKGETYGLVGESGCGKTTIARLMVGLEKPDSGTVTIGGHEVSRLRGRVQLRERRDLQMVFQDPYSSLDPRMRVRSILAEPLVVQRTFSKADRDKRVVELLGEVGLPVSSGRQLPREFSGGQRQRIGFARALALSPRLIVADEPVSALDVSIRAQLLNLMVRLQAEHELALVMVSHDLSVVRYIADRIGVMYLGKLVETGPTDTVYEAPAHPYTSGLLEAVPVADLGAARVARERAAIRGELPSPINPPSGCRFRTRCPRAQEKCVAEEPPLLPLLRQQGGFAPHEVACHFPLHPTIAASLRYFV
jgi:oligopeptide/dipeptide ABC transporter ATP-binding protein